MSNTVIHQHTATGRHDRDWEIEVTEGTNTVRVRMAQRSRVFTWKEVNDVEPVFEEFEHVPVRAFRGLIEKLGQLYQEESQP